MFRREKPARRLMVGHFANNNMLKMKYRKTYKTKNFLYLYLLHLFDPPVCSELEFSKSTYLLYSPDCMHDDE